MIVVSDTSPLNYLILIGLPDILPKLFDRVLIGDSAREMLPLCARVVPLPGGVLGQYGIVHAAVAELTQT
jgi:predicted nucleic acid-binding protein